jgi:hypothetical protein
MISVLTPSIRPQFLDITQRCLENQTFTDFEWIVEVGLRNYGYRLPSDLNRLLSRANGDRIVFLQDCIHIEPNALERIDMLPNHMITFPVGQVMSFGDEPSWDWRKHHDGSITPNQWEADFAAAPTQAFFDVGGYDESFNKGWSWENVEIAWRIRATDKYPFLCYSPIAGIALQHDAIIENPFRNKRENNDKRAEETRAKASRGEFLLNYLHR